MSTTRTPRFNHVAMSVPADLLDAEGRGPRSSTSTAASSAAGAADMVTEDRQRLVLRVHSDEQFVFLIAEDDPMRCPRLDHFGMSVGTLDELEDLYKKVQEKAAAEPDVDVVQREVESYEGYLNLHNFYVRYMLPMMVEVQHFEYLHTPANSG